MIWLLRRTCKTIQKEPAKCVYEFQLWTFPQMLEYRFQFCGIWWVEDCYTGTSVLHKLPIFIFNVVQEAPEHKTELKIEAVSFSETLVPIY